MEAVISESFFEKQKSSFYMLNRNWVFILLFSDLILSLLISNPMFITIPRKANNISLSVCTHLLNHDAYLIFAPHFFLCITIPMCVSSIISSKNFSPSKCKKYSWGAKFLSIQLIGPGLYCGVNFKQSSGPTISFWRSTTCVQSL